MNNSLLLVYIEIGLLRWEWILQERKNLRGKKLITAHYIDSCSLYVFCRHNDIPYQIRIKYHNRFENMTFGTSEPDWHTDIPRLREGKVGSQVIRHLHSRPV